MEIIPALFGQKSRRTPPDFVFQMINSISNLSGESTWCHTNRLHCRLSSVHGLLGDCHVWKQKEVIRTCGLVLCMLFIQQNVLFSCGTNTNIV